MRTKRLAQERRVPRPEVTRRGVCGEDVDRGEK